MTHSMIDDSASDGPISGDEIAVRIAVRGRPEACAGRVRGGARVVAAQELSDADTALATAGSAPIGLVCRHCGSTEYLCTGEGIAVLAEVRFVLGRTEPDHGDLPVLADSRRWSPEGGAVVRGNCDRVDLRCDELIAGVVLADPTPTGVPVASAPTSGAMS